MKFVKLMLVAVALSFSTAIFAADQSFGVNFLKGQADGDGAEFDVNGLNLKYGYKVTDYATIEVRGGFGLGKDMIDVMGIDVSASIDKMFGAYGKFHYDLEDGYSPYFVLGYTEGKFEIEALGMTSTETETDISYGIGLDINGDNGIFTVEYMMYMDKDGFEYTGLSFGYATTF